MSLTKLINTPMPEKLIESIKKLTDFPKAIKLVDDFYKIGIRTLKENHIYIPFIPYESFLLYNKQEMSLSVLRFKRNILIVSGKIIMASQMSAKITNLEENIIINALTTSYPKITFVKKVLLDKKDSPIFSLEYNLIDRKKPVIIKYF